jgi:nucleoid-associated protein YgaU
MKRIQIFHTNLMEQNNNQKPDFSNVTGGIGDAAKAGVQPVRPQEPKKYTVQKGDSLSKIAKHFYGDANKWKEIFEANKDTINDPDMIHPGQELKIPE